MTETESSDPHPNPYIFQRLCKMLPSRVVFRQGVGSPVAKQLSLTISFHTKREISRVGATLSMHS